MMNYSKIYKNWNLEIYAGKQGSKNPSVSWKDSRNAISYDNINEIVKTHNIFAKLGEGLIVVDFDGENWREGAEIFDRHFADLFRSKAIYVKTGSGKAHLYFFVDKKDIPNGLTKLVIVGNNYQIELRGKKHLITLPPSIHPSGNRYEFQVPEEKLLQSPDSIKLTPFELSLLMEYFGGLNTRVISASMDVIADIKDIREYIKKYGKIVDRILERAKRTITVGNRNDSLFKLAIQLRDLGFEKSETENILTTFVNNNDVFKKDFRISELINVIKSAYSRPARKTKIVPLYIAKEIFNNKYIKSIEEEINRYGYKRASINLVAKLLKPYYRIHALNGKMYKAVNKGYFTEANESELIDKISEKANLLMQYIEDERLIKELEKIKNISINSAEYKEIIMKLTQEETIDNDILYVKNGKIDLRTGELYPYTEDDFITNVSDVEYNPNAPIPEFFLDMISKMFEDNDIKEIQKLLGYLITSDISLRKFIILIGKGSNGKSTLFTILMNIIGRRFTHLLPSSFLDASRNDTDRLFAELYGKRLVVFEEFKEKTIDNIFLKSVVGNRYLTGRYIYGKPFEFQNTSKIVFLTNAFPILEFDQAIKDRLLILEITHRFNGNLNDVFEHINKEKEGILKFLVDGAIEYYKNKNIKLSDTAMKKAEELTYELDDIAMFLDEACIKNKSHKEKTIDVRRAFLKWKSMETGISVDRLALKYGQKWLTRRMKEHNIDVKRFRTGENGKREKYYIGIKIKQEFKVDVEF